MEPGAEHLAALAASDRAGPVVMLNLVRYREHAADGSGSGRDAYLRYSTRLRARCSSACGGTILWAGDVTGVAIGDDDADDWDYAVLVQYPDRQAFVDVMTSDGVRGDQPGPARRARHARHPAGLRDVLEVRRLSLARAAREAPDRLSRRAVNDA